MNLASYFGILSRRIIRGRDVVLFEDQTMEDLKEESLNIKLLEIMIPVHFLLFVIM